MGRRTFLVLASGLLLLLAAAPTKPATLEKEGALNQGGSPAVLNETEITDAIDRAMQYTKGKEAQGLPQYNDNIVDCGLYIVAAFPQYKDIIEDYKKWITEKDEYIEDYPYWSIRHVLSLGSIGQDQRAIEIFSKLKPIANDGKWEGVTYHLGWYLYGCIVADDKELLDKTLACLSEEIKERPDKFHYFTAYCVWKAYERTNDKKYKELFLTIMKSLKPFADEYIGMAATDGHMGLVLSLFCRALTLTRDEEYREPTTRLVDVLLKTQAQDGSWNDFAGYAVMPAEGLTAYWELLRQERERGTP